MGNSLTQEQIDRKFYSCYWRKTISSGASVCSVEMLPCIVAIEKGVCPMLKRNFRGRDDERNKEKKK